MLYYENKNKKGGQLGVALLYSKLQVGHFELAWVEFEFNDIISLYYEKTILSDDEPVSLW